MEGTLVAVSGAPPERADLVWLRDELSARLGHPVAVCTDLVAGLRQLDGARHVTVLPLPLTLAQDDGGLLARLRQFSQRWPFIAFHLAAGPSWLEWAELLAGEGPAVVTAEPSGDALADANLGRLAFLLTQRTGRRVEARLSDPEGLAWLESVARPALVDLLVARRAEARQDDSLPRSLLRELDRRVDELLPPQPLSCAPMGSADLLRDEAGAVAWDRMWTDFCDLAMAGGPCHRGTLLEAVPGPEALADPDRYRAVVAEIERGIRLAAGLPVVQSPSPGWVGVRCESEEMAVWMLRAIIVENVMVRREGEVLYLPAGPSFRLAEEVKNVVTAVAKTFHYWTEHQRFSRGRSSEPTGPRPGP